MFRKQKCLQTLLTYLIYDGEQVIKPERLTDMDTTQYVIPYHEDEKGKPEAAQKCCRCA